MNDRLTPSQSTKTSALIVAALGSFLTPFMISSVNVALPAIQRVFPMDAVVLSWVATSYLLAAAVFLVPMGKLADIHGRKRIYLTGILIFTGASLASALSVSAPMLIACRVVQGMGSAMLFATGLAIISSVFPPGERGKALGITVASVYMGLSCGPFFGGILTQYLSWRSIFLVNLPLGGYIVWRILFRLPGEWAESRGDRFDLTGAVIYGAALVAFMYGISRIPSPASVLLSLAGILGMAGFVWWELRVSFPVFRVDLFRSNRVFAFSCVAALINYSATFGVTFLLSLYLQYIKGYAPREAGFLLIAQPLVMAVFSPMAGRMSDRMEPRIIASTGMGITALALVFLAFISMGTGTAYIVGNLVLLGFGFALFSSPNMNAIMSAVDRRDYGVASGSVGTMRLLGQMLSMGIATLVFALLIGRVQITPDRYPDFVRSVQVAFTIFALLCAVGIFLSLARGRLR